MMNNFLYKLAIQICILQTKGDSQIYHLQVDKRFCSRMDFIHKCPLSFIYNWWNFFLLYAINSGKKSVNQHSNLHLLY